MKRYIVDRSITFLHCVFVKVCLYLPRHPPLFSGIAFNKYYTYLRLSSVSAQHSVASKSIRLDQILNLALTLQVIEVILPMLCNYLSYWWEKGSENSPTGAQCCTMVTSEHLSLILGNILKILNNNLGIEDAPWMKRIAGKCQAVRERKHFLKGFSSRRIVCFPILQRQGL